MSTKNPYSLLLNDEIQLQQATL